MKTKIKLLALLLTMMFSNNIFAQLKIRNLTQYPVTVGVGWFSEDQNDYTTKGWFNLASGEIVEPGIYFTSNTDAFYYYALTDDGELEWAGEYNLYVKLDAFENEFASQASIYGSDENYYVLPFRKEIVSFDFKNNKREYTLDLIGIDEDLAPIAENNIEDDNSFEDFFKNFKSAVIKGDKETVFSLTNIPFEDAMIPNNGILTCNNKKEFMEKYDKIFNASVKNALVNDKYRGYDSEGDLDLSEGEYLLLVGSSPAGNSQDLVFKIINGKYKLVRIQSYA